MNPINWIICAAVAAIIALVVWDINNEPTGSQSETAGVVTFTTADGVDCVWRKKGYGAGLSCNWEKYNLEQGITKQ